MNNTHGKKPKGKSGFTFTLSIVLLAITLIAVASFAQEWRKSQQVSFTEILPSESVRLQERVAAGIGQMVQADGSIKSDNSSTILSISTQQPFKREGQDLAQLSDYSESLPSNLRNLGYEAVLDANKISGSSSAVIVTSNNGSLVHSNEGAYDVTTFYQPSGFVPNTIYASISCDKQAESVGDIYSVGGTGGAGQYYVINYVEPSGRSYLRNYYANPGSNTSLRITYPDNTLLYFDSRFSPYGQNTTSVHFTKSSSGALILPFNQNSTDVVRDYSLFRENVTLASNNSTPAWKSDCSRGGCYRFDGKGDYMYVPGGVSFTDSEIPLPLGTEKVQDPWFEAFGKPAVPEDGSSDEWFFWHIENPSANDIFDATQTYAQSYYSVNATAKSGSNGIANIYQDVEDISPSTPYILSFWSKSPGGSAGRYRLEIQADSGHGVEKQCLEADGATWSQTCTNIFTTVPSTAAYSRTTREFMSPSGSSPTSPYTVPLTLIIRFYVPAAVPGEVYYDSVSLKQSAGMNGGFESYYTEGGSLLPPD